MAEDFISENKISGNATVIELDFCGLYNLPKAHLECINITTSTTDSTLSQNESESESESTSYYYCIYCPRSGYTFSTGEGLDDYYSRGHLTSLAIHGASALIAAVGALATCLILAVLRRRAPGNSFNILLSALAWMDLACCVGYVYRAAAITSWFQNWDRSFVTLFSIYLGFYLTYMPKSASTLITIVITIERYVAIAFPFSAIKRAFSPFRTKVLVGLVSLFTCFHGAVRLSYVTIGRNRVDPGIESTRQLDYLIYKSWTSSSGLRYVTYLVDLFELVVSIPVLLLFNGLIFYKIRKISAQRKELSSSVQRELNAGKMMLPVVAVLLFCSIIPICAILSFLGKGTNEMMVLITSCFALNSAANFPLYYWNSLAFRAEAKVVLASWFGRWWWGGVGGPGRNNKRGSQADILKTPRTSISITTDISSSEG